MKATPRHLATITAFIFLVDSTSLQAAPTQGLVAYYPLNGNANDMSGNAHNGTATGTSPTTNKFGDPNTALFFNGTTDLITLPIQQNGVLKSTYSVWFKTSAGGVLLGTSAPSNLSSLVLGVVTTGTGGAGVGQAIWVADAAHVSVGHQPDSVYNDNQWHHFVGVFDSVAGQLNPAQFKLYIDGKLVLKAHSVNPPNAPINNSAFMRIGSNQRWVATGGNFTGSIDDVRIYDRALTAEEVQEIYYLDDVDRDGILDRYETGTGIYVSPTDTGTSPSNADSDGDGIKDGTELTQYGTNPNLKDSDGDGFEDLFEINTGFNPASAISTPDALSSIRTAVEFRFNAANGVSYRIESSTDLVDWQIVEPLIIGASSVVTRFYSTENMPQRFFRARRN